MTEAIRQGDIPGVQLRCRATVHRPVADLWPFLVEPARLESWLCRQATVEGDTAEWIGALDLEDEPTERLRLLDTVAPRLLLASLSQPGWTAATRLEIEMTQVDGGSEVSVLQNGFEHLPLSISLTVWEAYRRRWRASLERLAGVSGQGPDVL